MICPKCEMEIDEVILVEKKTKIGILEGNKIVNCRSMQRTVSLNKDSVFYIECPECGNEINYVSERGFAFKSDDSKIEKYLLFKN